MSIVLRVMISPNTGNLYVSPCICCLVNKYKYMYKEVRQNAVWYWNIEYHIVPKVLYVSNFKFAL